MEIKEERVFLLQKVFLIDQSEKLVKAWKEAFSGFDNFEIIQGDFFSKAADAMISPANSFGIMDGGLDLAIRNTLGFEVEERVQRRILDDFHGELSIGSAVIVGTDNARWPYLISAPTMRIPEDVSNTLNPYIAFRAVLLAIKTHNLRSERKINSILCPGLGTGIGRVEPRKCAAHMRVAYTSLSKPARTPSYNEIHEVHRRLQMVV
ncbi:macro domain-containing protein [Hahella sp. CR1]|uniref:macro domain-containing protein n=1 Tax=Hahella sp. CR1 TaxID=2992807 RepID=UPI00244298DE|nr:macro domain-containing protein [Hahella sp. CR1]MDG9671367.1 macro domain-containing protein [Hahella sp. CR1]